MVSRIWIGHQFFIGRQLIAHGSLILHRNSRKGPDRRKVFDEEGGIAPTTAEPTGFPRMLHRPLAESRDEPTAARNREAKPT